MNRILFSSFVLSLLLFSSCGEKKVIFRENQSFGENYEWFKKDKKVFKIDIKENKHAFEFSLAFRYATGFPYDKARFRISEIDPSGNKISSDVDLQIRDAQGEFLGEKGYDIIDIETILDAKKVYPAFGVYTYEIEQIMPNIDPLIFSMEIGLILRDPAVE